MKKLLLLILLISCTQAETVRLCFETKCINAEVADTFNERRIGLMHRKHLPKNRGMLFIFEQPEKHSFWMKNTLIPLDIMWIDENQKIVHIEKAEPCKQEPCTSYKPPVNAKYVVEVNKGFAEKHNIEVGQKIKQS